MATGIIPVYQNFTIKSFTVTMGHAYLYISGRFRLLDFVCGGLDLSSLTLDVEDRPAVETNATILCHNSNYAYGSVGIAAVQPNGPIIVRIFTALNTAAGWNLPASTAIIRGQCSWFTVNA